MSGVDEDERVCAEVVEETTVRFTEGVVLTVDPTVEPEDRRLFGVRSMCVVSLCVFWLLIGVCS